MLTIELSKNLVRVTKLEASAQGAKVLDCKEAVISSKDSASDETVAKLRELVLQMGGNHEDVQAVFWDPGTIIRQITIPFVARSIDEIPLAQTVQKYLTLPPEEYLLRLVDPVKTGAQLKATLVAVPKSVLNFYVSALKKAQVRVVNLAPGEILYLEFCRQAQFSKTDVICFFRWEERGGELIFLQDGKLVFTRQVNIGIYSFRDPLVGKVEVGNETYEFTEAEAEKFIFQNGLYLREVAEGVPSPAVFEVLRPVLLRFLREIELILNYFKEEFQLGTITKFYLAGKGAAVGYLPQFFSQKLNLTAEVLALPVVPFAGSRALNLLAVREKSPVLVFVLKNSVLLANLLFFLAILFYCNAYLSFEVARTNLLLHDKQKAAEQIRLYETERQVIQTVTKQFYDLRQFFDDLTAVLPSGVSLVNINYDNTKGEIYLMGEAQNMNGIADLLIAIEKSQSFKTAFLSSARKDEIKGKINFVVTFKRDS